MKPANQPAASPGFGATLLLLAASSCGGESSTTVAEGALEFLGTNVQDGQTWTLDGPIELRFTQPIDFGSVTFDTVQVRDAQGVTPLGVLTSGTLTSGQPDASVIRFIPVCPDAASGSSAGLQPGGLEYTVLVRGDDSGSGSLVSTSGFPLRTTASFTFQTPTSLDPADLFHDPLPTPARVIVRGAGGVSLSELNATHVEIGVDPVQRAYFSGLGAGFATLDPAAVALLPNGLPLNHRVAFENRVAFVIHFDQPIAAAPSNIDRIGIEYLNGTWKKLRGRTEIAKNCAGEGFSVRFLPEGMLPRGTSLRIAIDPGLLDRAGQQNPGAVAGIVDVRTNDGAGTAGAAADALLEGFFLGGTDAGSIEDTESTLASPRAYWNDGALIPQPDASGKSMARSKWVHLGYGKIDPGMPDRSARFLFAGVDEDGAVEHVGGVVTPIADAMGPIPLTGMEASAVSMNLGQLPDLSGTYLSHPATMSGSRVVFLPGDSSVPGGAGGLNFYGATAVQGVLRLAIFGGCFIPGFGSGDCVPLNLFTSFSGPTGIDVQIVPQFFELYTWFDRDTIPPDAAVRIQFDAAMAGTDGEPDPTTALSATSGWTSDPALLSSGAWDFVRFQVLFDLDASGDGWSLAEGRPALNFVKLVWDHGH